MVDYLANAPFDCVVSPSFSAFTDELHGKGREERISMGGCIIVVVVVVDDDGDRKRRRLNIVYIRSSKSVRRRFLFLGSTRERVSVGDLPRRCIIRRCGGTRTKKGERSDRAVNVPWRYPGKFRLAEWLKDGGEAEHGARCCATDIINKSRSNSN